VTQPRYKSFPQLDELELALLSVAELENHIVSYLEWCKDRPVPTRYLNVLRRYCPHRVRQQGFGGSACTTCNDYIIG
jgi:hypothetical protein